MLKPGRLHAELVPLREGDVEKVADRTVSRPVSTGSGRTDTRRLRGAGRKAVLTVHIAAALGLFGASLALIVGGLYAASRDDGADAHAIYSLLRLLTLSVDIPLAVITLLAGLALALTSRWRLFRYWWVTGKLALYAATVSVGVTLLGPSIDTMLDVTEVDNPAESGTRWIVVVLPTVQLGLLLAAASLGVFKPGRARAGRSKGGP